MFRWFGVVCSLVLVLGQSDFQFSAGFINVTTNNSNTSYFHQIRGCAIFGDRLLIAGNNLARTQFAATVVNRSDLSILNTTQFQLVGTNPTAEMVVLGSEPDALPNPLIYFTPRLCDVACAIHRFELLPDSQLNSTSFVVLSTSTGVHLGWPICGTLDETRQMLYYGAANCDIGSPTLHGGRKLCVGKVNLVSMQVELVVNVSEFPTGNMTTMTNGNYDTFDYSNYACLLVDPVWNLLFVVAHDVFMLDPNSLVTLSSLSFHGQERVAAIDTQAKILYVADDQNSTLRKISYSIQPFQLVELEATSLFPGSSVSFATLLFDPAFRFLYLTSSCQLHFFVAWDVDAWALIDLFDFATPGCHECGALVDHVAYYTEHRQSWQPVVEGEYVFRMQFTGVCAVNANSSGGCYQCPPGNYVANGGTFQNPNVRVCVPCPFRTYSTNFSSPGCLPCPLNKISTGMSECTMCPPLAFYDNITDSCICQLGAELVNSVCTPCGTSKVRGDLRTQNCDFCPDNSFATDNATRCECLPNRYQKIFNNSRFSCELCPSGGFCNGSAIVVAQRGRWSSDGETFFVCPQQAACEERGCASSYQSDSFMCGACAEGSSVTSSLEACVPCDSANVWIFVVFVVGATILIVRLFRSDGKNNFLGVLIIINHLQILSEVRITPDVVDSTQAAAIQHYSSFLALLKVFQFQFLSLSSQFCVFPGSFSTEWLAQLCVPLVLLGWAGLAAIVVKLKRLALSSPTQDIPLGDEPKRSGSTPIRYQFAQVAINILKLCLIGNTKLALLMMNCRTFGSKVVLVSYPSLDCWSSSHVGLVVVAVLSLVLFVLITFGSVGIVLFKKGSLNAEFLSGDYADTARYWELVLLVRRLLVAAFVTLLSGVERSWWLVLTLCASFAIQMYKHPFTSIQVNQYESRSLAILHLSFMLGLLAQASVSNVLFSIVMIFLLNIGLILFYIPTTYKKLQSLFQAKTAKTKNIA